VVDLVVLKFHTIISTQKFKLLGEVPKYDLYYFLTHPLKGKFFGFKTCTGPHYLVLNFYQINRMVRFELVTVWSLKL
jgi:hypothetical protein